MMAGAQGVNSRALRHLHGQGCRNRRTRTKARNTSSRGLRRLHCEGEAGENERKIWRCELEGFTTLTSGRGSRRTNERREGVSSRDLRHSQDKVDESHAVSSVV